MAEVYDVVVKVISQKGTCAAGHKVGDEWIISGKEFKTPQDICLYVFGSLYPIIMALKYGGTFPWATDPDAVPSACPDPDNPVVFEVKRLPK